MSPPLELGDVVRLRQPALGEQDAVLFVVEDRRASLAGNWVCAVVRDFHVGSRVTGSMTLRAAEAHEDVFRVLGAGSRVARDLWWVWCSYLAARKGVDLGRQPPA